MVADMVAVAVADIAIVMVHLHQVVMVHPQEAEVVTEEEEEVDGVAVSTNGRSCTTNRLRPKLRRDLIAFQ